MAGYAATLRTVLLHSGDVRPDIVQEYLGKVGRSRDHDLQEFVLLTYVPLVDHLPDAYTEFALQVLRYSPKLGYNEHSFEPERLGIVRFGRLFPATPTQGPFLYLLRRDEQSGLRLVHGLANWAAEWWRTYRQRPRDATDHGAHDIPIELHLTSGIKQLWGDQNVYYWFRGTLAPEAVGSALMALEMWMERQVEDGRDPLELFTTVLEGSECVAVLGTCLAVALAFPDRSLEAALSILQSPRIWLWDIARLAADARPALRFDPTGDYQWADEINAERAKRPQRTRDVRVLALAYAFAGGDLWQRFEQQLLSWTPEGLLQFEEQHGIPTVLEGAGKELDRILIYAARQNYVEIPSPEGPALTFRPPEGVQTQVAAELGEQLQLMVPGLLRIWARASLAADAPASGMDVDDALSRAQDLQSRAATGDGEVAWERLEAIAGVAAAALRVGYDTLQQRDLVDWAYKTLIDVIPSSQREEEPVGLSVLHPRAAAAMGLSALLMRGRSPQGLRERLLELTADGAYEVRNATFAALGDLWREDESLCWAAVNLAQALAVAPAKAKRDRTHLNALELLRREQATRRAAEDRRMRIIRTHIAALQAGRAPRVPAIPVSGRGSFNPWVFAPALYALPPRPMERQDICEMLLTLQDRLLTWTIAVTVGQERRTRYDRDLSEWIDRLMLWCAGLLQPLRFENFRTHVLEPVERAWPKGPALTKALLDGLIRVQFYSDAAPSEDAQRAWSQVCTWVLNSKLLRTDAWWFEHLGRDVHDSIDLIVFGTWLGPKPPATWPHARLFADVFQTWVETVGHFPGPYSAFLEFITTWGWSFTPEPLLTWLRVIVGHAADLPELWSEHNNGDRTAQLLQRVSDEHQASIAASEDSLARMSVIVDRLVLYGSPLAGALQLQLESMR